MTKEDKPQKKTKETPKKEKSKYGLSKETLERILEEKPRKEDFPLRKEKESILSEEELKNISGMKSKKKEQEEDILIPASNQRRIFLENEVESEASLQSSSTTQNSNQNSSEYISNAINSEKEKKYINYETSPNIRFESAKKISESWSNPLGREAGFVSSINSPIEQTPQYEVYINPRNFSEEEMKERNKKKDLPEFTMREAKIHYDH